MNKKRILWWFIYFAILIAGVTIASKNDAMFGYWVGFLTCGCGLVAFKLANK